MKQVFTALMLCAATQATAQDQSLADALAVDDRVWVTQDVTAATKLGLTPSMLGVVRFEGTQVTDSFAAVGFFMLPPECPSFDGCQKTLSRAAYLTADYTVDGATLALSDIAATGVTPDQGADRFTMRAQSLLQTNTDIALTLDGDILTADLPTGPRNYVALDEAHLDGVLGMMGGLAFSMSDNAACLIRLAQANMRGNLPPIWTDAFALTALQWRNYIRFEALRDGSAIDGRPTQPDLRLEYDTLAGLDLLTRFYTFELETQFEAGLAKGAAVAAADELFLVELPGSEWSAGAEEAAIAQFNALRGQLAASLPLITDLQARGSSGMPLHDTVCAP